MLVGIELSAYVSAEIEDPISGGHEAFKIRQHDRISGVELIVVPAGGDFGDIRHLANSRLIVANFGPARHGFLRIVGVGENTLANGNFSVESPEVGVDVPDQGQLAKEAAGCTKDRHE